MRVYVALLYAIFVPRMYREDGASPLERRLHEEARDKNFIPAGLRELHFYAIFVLGCTGRIVSAHSNVVHEEARDKISYQPA
jgi:hypothetical protein